MTFEWYHWALAIVGGVAAGIINTLAGAGSMVTLSLFVFLGLPPTVANGTNRVGIVFQSIIAMRTMRKNTGSLELEGAWGYLASIVSGAALGAQLATRLSDEDTSRVIGLFMLLMLALILRGGHKWERVVEQPPTSKLHKLMLYPGFFLVGAYGGFLQAGIGILLLIALVQWSGMTMLRANKLKLSAALLLTIPSLAIFAYSGLVHWEIGLLMALTQGVGAWLGATFLTRYERANIWVRRVLIVDILFGVAKFWGILDYVWSLLSG
jgi:uncharacterized membrane protein YfcA